MSPCSSTVAFGCVVLVIEACSCCRLLKCQCSICSRVGYKTRSWCVTGSCEGKGWKGVKELMEESRAWKVEFDCKSCWVSIAGAPVPCPALCCVLGLR